MDALLCHRCVGDRAKHAFQDEVSYYLVNVPVEPTDGGEALTVPMDVRQLRWRTQRDGHCTVEAVIALGCPSCDSAHRVYCPLDAPLSYVQSSRRCQTCRSTLELLDHVVDYTEPDQGDAIITISAVLRCSSCGTGQIVEKHSQLSGSPDLLSQPRLELWLGEDAVRIAGRELKDRGRLPSARRRAFISYRREGGAAVARLLRQELLMEGWYAFLDVEDLGAVRFDEQLLQEIEQSEAVIVILSPGALDRCSHPDDWVRQEIAYALGRKKQIVPICMEQFTFPKHLPDEIAGLLGLNYVPYSHHFFRAMVERLMLFLTK